MLGQWAGTRQYHVYNQRGCLLAGCRRVSPAVAACWLLPLHSHRPARAIHARAVTCQLITIISIMPICPEWWNAVNRWIVRCQLRTYQSHNRNEYLREPLLTSLLIVAPLMIDIVVYHLLWKKSKKLNSVWISQYSVETKLNSNQMT